MKDEFGWHQCLKTFFPELCISSAGEDNPTYEESFSTQIQLVPLTRNLTRGLSLMFWTHSLDSIRGKSDAFRR
ncbi:hypothetical protein RP20_CCG024771 [Aedes albopictus]|nr:hypothetical protein RP20_CCG024771 [Aedes albopictus]